MHRDRIDGLVRGLRLLLDHHNRNRITQVDFLLRFNLIMFQYMTYERPLHLDAVLTYERNRARMEGRIDEVEAGREALDQIVLSMRERFEQ